MRTSTLFTGLVLCFVAIADTPPTPAMVANFSGPPAGFEENKGQVRTTAGDVAPFVRYRLTQGNTQLFLLNDGIAYQFSRMHYPAGYQELVASRDPKKQDQLDAMRDQIRLETFRMNMLLEGANPAAHITTEGRSADYTQYYNHDALDVHTYTKLTYHEVYPGIDWVVYTTEKGMKYDFVVRPGADPDRIRLRFEHHEELAVDADGNLIHGNRMGRFTEERPVSFQDGKAIATHFVLEGNTLRFTLGHYDRNRALTIDPDRIWGTYYGGDQFEIGYGCTTDLSGSVYISGSTSSSVAIGAGGHQITFGGDDDAFLVKFNSQGQRLWGTYYGGAGEDEGYDCITDGNGNVYLTGRTNTTDGISSGGHQNAFGGYWDAFLVKFNGNGIRLWGTYYGGTGYEGMNGGCAMDASGNIFLSGSTTSTEGIASGGHQNTPGSGSPPMGDAFLVKFNPEGTRLWGTYFGGNNSTSGQSCAVDATGAVYLAGATSSTSTISADGHQADLGGIVDCYLAKFNTAGVRQWATYYGGSGIEGLGSVAVDDAGNAYLAGRTTSTNGIAFLGHQNTYSGGTDAFLVKFSSVGDRSWGTYYGGTALDNGFACAVDVNDNAYLVGLTVSTADIAYQGYQNILGGMRDAFLVKFNGAGQREWGTYYGGSQSDDGFDCTIDSDNNVYLTGPAASPSSIAVTGHQNTFGGMSDAFLVKFGCGGDTDGDGIADCEDDCPNTPGEIGSPCDDDQSNTLNDLVGADCVCAGTPTAITLISSFNPTDAGGFCGLAYDADSSRIWAYDCSSTIIQQYTSGGASVRSIPRAGESTNDVDLSIAPEQIALGTSSIPYGRLLFVNGEEGTADIYGIEQDPGSVIDTLDTAFGLDHVVGGAYHAIRNSYFLVQDDDANAINENRVAEVDPITGEVLNTFQFTGTFAVNYGDLEVSAATGNLFLVSNSQLNVAEFSPTGELVHLHPLPSGVVNLSGISLDCSTGTAWACNSSGVIYHLGGFPCQITDICSGGPEPGTSCDDNNAGTINDVITSDCTCEGDINTGFDGSEAADTELRVWPNPATDEVWIEIGAASNEPATVIVRDPLGRTIVVLGPIAANGSGQYVVQLGAMAQGTYILDLHVGGKRWSSRIVKA